MLLLPARLTIGGSLLQDVPVIGITLTSVNAAIADVRPWITTTVDPYMTVVRDRTGAGTSA
jgi:hypothetical protein